MLHPPCQDPLVLVLLVYPSLQLCQDGSGEKDQLEEEPPSSHHFSGAERSKNSR